MAWEVEYTDQFEEWWKTLSGDQQEAITQRVILLQNHGPSLGRPVVDTIEGSRLPDLKELRSGRDGALRVLFAFNPLRNRDLASGW